MKGKRPNNINHVGSDGANEAKEFGKPGQASGQKRGQRVPIVRPVGLGLAKGVHQDQTPLH